jgi:hypothetical protein
VGRKYFNPRQGGLCLVVALLFGESAGADQVQIEAARRQVGRIGFMLRLVLDQ